MRVVDTDEMREIEKTAIEEFGLSESLIIEHVAIRGADILIETIIPKGYRDEVVVLVGAGNNGADGLAVARQLKNKGISVRAFLVFPDDQGTQEYQKQALLASNFGVKVSELNSLDALTSYLTQTQEQPIVIDAIIGVGLSLPISNYLFDLIQIINQESALVVSVDLPTGVTSDTGSISGAAIRADFTLAVGLPKTGHFVNVGGSHCGEIVVIDIGLPESLVKGGDKGLLTSQEVAHLVKVRNQFAHKNTFGHCLVIGGSLGLTGAAVMASRAALKVGTGLVTAITWAPNYPELCTRMTPEVMTGLIPEEEEEVKSNIRDLHQFDSIIIGPGLGRGERVREIVVQILSSFSGPVVVDADALRVLRLKNDCELLKTRKGATILTPHMGEFADFVDAPIEEVLEKPIEYLQKVVDRLSCTVVMKGACSYIGFPNGKVMINYFPNDGMASGGSGDVLAGIIGGLLAQVPFDRTESGLFLDKTEVYNSVTLGVMTHTLAGKYAVDKLGPRAMTALSIVDHFADAFKELEENREQSL